MGGPEESRRQLAKRKRYLAVGRDFHSKVQPVQFVQKDEEIVYNRVPEFKPVTPEQRTVFKKNKFKEKYNLPHRHYKVHRTSKLLPNRMAEIRNNPSQPSLDYLNAFNSTPHSNLVWNQEENWVTYSAENMLIVEWLQEERT